MQIAQLEEQIGQIEAKKDKLLELSMADAISLQEFKTRNGRFNRQISALEEQLSELRRQEQQSKTEGTDFAALEQALWEEMNFINGISSEVVSTILDHVVVLEESSDRQIHLNVHLRLGKVVSAQIQRAK